MMMMIHHHHQIFSLDTNGIQNFGYLGVEQN
jgi:hypothetical protein